MGVGIQRHYRRLLAAKAATEASVATSGAVANPLPAAALQEATADKPVDASRDADPVQTVDALPGTVRRRR